MSARLVMKSTWLLLIVPWLAGIAGFPAPVPHGRPRQLYVEQFVTHADEGKLRADVIDEIEKLDSVSLTADAARADLVLGGGGDIWITGYRSFNPRSHAKEPANGIAVYGGFLSVELKNKQGITIWSYLATPNAAFGDGSKEIAKRVAKHLVEALNEPQVPTAQSAGVSPVNLSGAGATFPAPVYRKWFTNFQIGHAATAITYNAIGSEAGMRKLLAGAEDFGASDSPDVVRQIAPGEDGKYLFFPSVVGAVVPIVNLPGVRESIAFTPEALAGIFLGRIKKWNDPILKQANRGVRLPDLEIVVVHREEGSGTSYAWTDYLSKVSADWKNQVGASLAPNWPVGSAATGNDGVVKLVKEMGGAIGYVEFIYALENDLSPGRIRNRNGEFVAASLESLAAAATDSAALPDNFKGSIVDAPGVGAYPITSFTWIVIPAHIADKAKREAIITFLRWMLGPGQRQAAALGYLALPQRIVERENAAIAKLD